MPHDEQDRARRLRRLAKVEDVLHAELGIVPPGDSAITDPSYVAEVRDALRSLKQPAPRVTP